MGEIAINPIHNVHKKYRTMNFVNPYIFAPPVDLTTNTEIGGVAATINTPALLATRLGIDVSRVTNFTIVGSDIKCRITGNYIVPDTGFGIEGLITYYRDEANLVTDIASFAFKNNALGTSRLKLLKFNGIVNLTGTEIINTANVETIYLENCISIANNAFVSINSIGFQSKMYCYIPNCTSLGSTSGSNNVFSWSLLSGSIIVCHPSLATNNGGSPDGDIQSAILQGATIRYKTNTTAPSQITTLAAGTIYNTAIQLNFTPPSSTNSIEYYECYANGVLKNTITASGQYITGLTPNMNYSITLKAVDIFYNKSVVSNSVSSMTTNFSNTYYPSSDVDVSAFLTASGITDTTVSNSVVYLAFQLKNNSLWTKEKAVYPMVGGTAFTHKWNLKDPRDLDGAFRLTFNGGLTHSSTGILPNGTSGFADTKLTPNTSLALNSGRLSFYSRTNSNSGNPYDIASSGVGDVNPTYLITRYSSNNAFFGYGNATYAGATPSSNSIGFWMGNRNDYSNSTLWKNGMKIKTQSEVVTMTTFPLFLFAFNGAGTAKYFSNKECSFASIGEGLTDSESLIYYNIIQQFQTMLGRQM